MRTWKCRKCGLDNPRTKQKCSGRVPLDRLDNNLAVLYQPCSGRRPAPRKPKHEAVLELPYSWWVERFGEACNICGSPPSATRKLDRDHDHKTGEARGLLCHMCNRTLGNRVDTEWLEKATNYLRRVA